MSVTGAIDPTRKTIRHDPLEGFARALGYRVDELRLAGEPSHHHLLAMEVDTEAVTTAIAARRPPLEESILRAQRAAIVPLSVLGTARQLVGKTTGRALAKLVIESAIAAWRRDAVLASELRLPPDAAARLKTLMSATKLTEDSMRVPEEQSCWRQLNQVLTGERVFDLTGAVELLNEGGTAAEVSELIVDTLDVAQSGMAATAQARIHPRVNESSDLEKALAERLELCAAHNPLRRKRCEDLKRELDKAFGSSDPLPDHLFQQVASVFGDHGPAYVIWWLELLLARLLCHFVWQVQPFLQAAGGSVLLLVDAVRTLKSGAAEPSVERLLQSFELPGVPVGSFNWVNAALEISQHHGTFRFCIEFAHEREKLMRRVPIRESLEVHFVDPIENGRHDPLNNLVLQRRNAQRALPPAGPLKYQQPRRPVRNSGSTPAVPGTSQQHQPPVPVQDHRGRPRKPETPASAARQQGLPPTRTAKSGGSIGSPGRPPWDGQVVDATPQGGFGRMRRTRSEELSVIRCLDPKVELPRNETDNDSGVYSWIR